ncbi:ACP phosphodiesterase [Caballeronia sordidicola]|uniref:FMN dependent NADH:quinone oxidoreductase n=1 Tax=Caballeronia sordidicola TaxID=196367 RepID=A0A158GS79_CABSO|nr:NAD(P)H-dependent oxidoreductase [Caballeronia sordidicola]SAL34727.1 ACP phosphodiesterase [Caballeronia sordidicola]
MRLLHVVASPRAERSASLDVAQSLIGHWHDLYPQGEVDTLDVWRTELPPFDGPALGAKYAGIEGTPMSAEQDRAWRQIGQLAERFRHADVIVISTPMWNFGIPYRLKHLIDAVSQKDLLFTFDGKNLTGLLAGKRLIVIAARGAPLGGDYPEADFDHQVAYLRTWDRMAGITRFEPITVEGTLLGHQADQQGRRAARAKAAELIAQP